MTEMMYSLYRAWLMRDAITATSLATPPDVVVCVGTENHQFFAHRDLLSIHSGYLKSLLHEPLPTVSVPNVMPDVFAHLLTFMYTGYLDLNQDNIYSILLATHLLHMPRALELCRAFLVHRQPAPFPFPSSPSIVKPVPSRKVYDFSQPLWTQPSHPPPLLLHASPNGPFQSVAPSEKTPVEPLPGPSTAPTVPTQTELTPAPSPTPLSSATSDASDEVTVHTLSKTPKRVKKVNDENMKAVLDVACCDGPVQFHRVLNESYGITMDPTHARDTESTDQKFSNFMHQQMLNSNMYKKSKTSKGVIQLRKIVENEVESNENDIFTCVHCNHTFKSHFCYEKHIRRHINHIDKLDVGGRREVRLLDMNVQYYPCKTCGSKFPSYYFVHKHRKMCHSEEGQNETEDEPKQQ